MTSGRILLFSLILSMLGAFLIVKLAAPDQSAHETAQNETAFARILRSNTIRCGYYISQDFIRRDEKTGRLSGPSYEIIEAMAKNLDLKIEWTGETSPATMAADLANARYDMICVPFSANAPRSKVLFFSRPVFYNPVSVWVHKDNANGLNDHAWANDPGVTFAAIDGISFMTLTKRFFPKAKIYSLPEMLPVPEMLVAVATKKADAALMSDINGDYYARQNNGVLRRAGPPVTLISMQFPLPHGDEKLRNMVDVTLSELLLDGKIGTIFDAYDSDPPRYFWKVREPYLPPAPAMLRAKRQ